jgi:hypothetical protein
MISRQLSQFYLTILSLDRSGGGYFKRAEDCDPRERSQRIGDLAVDGHCESPSARVADQRLYSVDGLAGSLAGIEAGRRRRARRRQAIALSRREPRGNGQFRSTRITRPRSIASASWPRLSARAASPNSSRRQPCSAPTAALSSAAICSRSSTVAMTLLATA